MGRVLSKTIIILILFVNFTACSSEEKIPEGMRKDTLFEECTIIVPKTWEKFEYPGYPRQISYTTEESNILDIYLFDDNNIHYYLNQASGKDWLSRISLIKKEELPIFGYPAYTGTLFCEDYSGNETIVKKLVIGIDKKTLDFRYLYYENDKKTEKQIDKIYRSIIINSN